MNYVEEILYKNISEEDKFYEIADIVVEREGEMTFNSLKQEEKNIYMLDNLLSEINNGGLDQYFFNTDGKFVTDTINLLKQIGQPDFAELIHRASEIYNSDSPDEDKFDLLNEFDEKIYSKIDFEGIYKSCLEYLRGYIHKFNEH